MDAVLIVFEMSWSTRWRQLIARGAIVGSFNHHSVYMVSDLKWALGVPERERERDSRPPTVLSKTKLGPALFGGRDGNPWGI